MFAQNSEQLHRAGSSFTSVLFWNKQEQSLGCSLCFPVALEGCFYLLHTRCPMDTSIEAGVQHRLWAVHPRAEVAPCARPARPWPAVTGTLLFSPASQTLLLSNSF